VLWKADQSFSGGGTNNANLDISGTADDVLYSQSRRASTDLGSFSYAIPVPASATYRVRLHFAETYWGVGSNPTGPGRRVFSANLEGGPTELANYDLIADVGPKTAVVKEFTLGVSDGTLNIDFSASVNRPIVSAIEVFQIGGAGGVTGKAGLSAPLRQTTPVTYTTFLQTAYIYDDVGRLRGETTGADSTTYGYDQAGNRTDVTRNGVTTSRGYNAANQVVGWTYDESGNLLSTGSGTNSYDALGRLMSVGSTTNSYNGDGILVQQQGPSPTTFINDLAAPLSQPLVIAAGSQTTESWYGLERLVTRTGSSNVRTWYLADGVGSVQLTLDDAGVLLTNPQYDAWGMPKGAAPTPFGFTGEYTDAQSGLVYLRARWYDPTSGTLLGRDPFAGSQKSPYSLHDYQYGLSNPVRYTDPSGRCATDVDDYCQPRRGGGGGGAWDGPAPQNGISPFPPAVGPQAFPEMQPIPDYTKPPFTRPASPIKPISPVEPLRPPFTIPQPVGGSPGTGLRIVCVVLLFLLGGDEGRPLPGGGGGGVWGQPSPKSLPETKTKPHSPPKKSDEDDLVHFYHGTNADHASDIMSNGIVPGRGQYMASGEGFYTFKEEKRAEGFSFSRGGLPAVVRVSMTRSVYQQLLSAGGATEGPYQARPGVIVPDTTEVVFTPLSFPVLNSSAVIKAWKQADGMDWTPYMH
jgi:RHS repeat-associated protein